MNFWVEVQIKTHWQEHSQSLESVLVKKKKKKRQTISMGFFSNEDTTKGEKKINSCSASVTDFSVQINGGCLSETLLLMDDV